MEKLSVVRTSNVSYLDSKNPARSDKSKYTDFLCNFFVNNGQMEKTDTCKWCTCSNGYRIHQNGKRFLSRVMRCNSASILNKLSLLRLGMVEKVLEKKDSTFFAWFSMYLLWWVKNCVAFNVFKCIVLLFVLYWLWWSLSLLCYLWFKNRIIFL